MEDSRQMIATFHTHLWRIRSLFWLTYCDLHTRLSTLLPPSVPITYAPMMQNLYILGATFKGAELFGNIHCPDLRTLTIINSDEAIESLISKPMLNVRDLHLTSDGPVVLYIKLLNVLPNLVSLEWISSQW